MTRTSVFSRWMLVALAALVALMPVASAQPDAERKAARIDRFAERLDLSDAQRAILTDAEVEPGALWEVAAALAPTLSDEQKATLFARPEHRDRGARHGGKGKGRRGDRGSRHEDHDERRAESHEAMKQALGLTSEQAEQLDAVRAAHQAQREARREEAQSRTPGDVPAELQAILTPEQQDVFKVHRALAMRMAAGRHAHGRGR